MRYSTLLLAALAVASTALPVDAAPPKPNAFRAGVFVDNDGTFVKPNTATDRHYTSGDALSLQWRSPGASAMVGSLPSLDGEFSPSAPGTSYDVGLVLSLLLYTPTNIADPNPNYADRPYAGCMSLGFVMQRATRAAEIPVFEHFQLDCATIGPSSAGANIQRWVHEWYDATRPAGWDHQIREDFGMDLRYQRRWQFSLGDVEGAAVQLIPEAGFTIGTMHINATTGAVIRLGWNIPDDFGQARLRYVSDFTAGTPQSSANGAYVFARATGRVVGHDSTIDGSFFRESPVEQDSRIFGAEFQVGIVFRVLRCIEISYAQAYTSPEFVGQANWDSFGSLNLAFSFMW